MTTMRRITGADWSAWFLYLWAAAVEGFASGIETAFITGAASVATNQQWVPMTNDWRIMLYAGIGGLVLSLARFLKKNPRPTGDEVDEVATTTETTNNP